MFETLRNAWKIQDIRKKILYTLLMIAIYRLGVYIPVAGVNVDFIKTQVGNLDLLGYLDIFSGGALANFTIFAMGITPYINASIIMNLLTIAIPALERMAKEGDEGRKKIENITRLAAIGFAFVQSVGILLGLGSDAILTSQSTVLPIVTYGTIGLVLTAGVAFLMWMGEKITQNGIGNGISMLIFASIVSRVPTIIFDFGRRTFTGEMTFWLLPVLIIAVVAVIAGVVLVDLGVRRVPVQYAKRVVGRKQYGGQSTHIPMRVNASGVLPLIFAVTIVQLPQMIAQFWPESKFTQWYATHLGSGSVVYFIVYALLIIAFAFFYTTISFNPVEMSKNLQQHGGFIPGIRPGKPTADYLKRISNRLTLVGGLFLAIIAALPTLFTQVLRNYGGSLGAAFGATSVLIMVSVALEVSKQIESQMVMRNYKGFLK